VRRFLLRLWVCFAWCCCLLLGHVVTPAGAADCPSVAPDYTGSDPVVAELRSVRQTEAASCAALQSELLNIDASTDATATRITTLNGAFNNVTDILSGTGAYPVPVRIFGAGGAPDANGDPAPNPLDPLPVTGGGGGGTGGTVTVSDLSGPALDWYRLGLFEALTLGLVLIVLASARTVRVLWSRS
jgi:hypothetical protein